MKSQRVMFKIARRDRHPAMLAEMRLGKTLAAIRRILLYRPHDPDQGLQILVAAPNSALGSWAKELRLEGEPDPCFLQGTRKQRFALLESGAKWNLINKEGYQALPEIADVHWDAVVVDESTFIANPKAKVTQFFLRNFRDAEHRWVLAGRANPESDMQFWTQLAFLDGRAFGHNNFWSFRTKMFEQRFGGHAWTPQVGTASIIRKEVGRRCCVLRRKDVDMEMPKSYTIRTFQLPKQLLKSYREVESDFILRYRKKELKKTKYSIGIHQWLRQMCGGFIDGEMVWDGKIKEVQNLLRGELKGESVVIWFDYNQELFAIVEALRQKGISTRAYYGEVSPAGRRHLEEEFQEKKFQVLLVQNRCAQMGADFSSASAVIYYSNPTGLLARLQTEDRTVNPMKGENTLYIDFLVEDSVDVDCYDHLIDKDQKSDYTLERALVYMKRRQEKDAA